MNIILPGHLIAKYKALATYRFIITSQNAGKGQVILEAAHQVAQSAFEPGDQATAVFLKIQCSGLVCTRIFFNGYGTIRRISASDADASMHVDIIRIRRSRRSAGPGCGPSGSKPRLLTMKNIGFIPQREPSSSTARPRRRAIYGYNPTCYLKLTGGNASGVRVYKF